MSSFDKALLTLVVLAGLLVLMIIASQAGIALGRM